MIAGVALLVSLSLLFASTPVVKSWGGSLKPLLQAYTWSSSSSTGTGLFTNTGTGYGVKGTTQSTTQPGVLGENYSSTGVKGLGLHEGVYGRSNSPTGNGVTASAPDGRALVANSLNNLGVLGMGGSGSGDYGGYFTGFEGVRGIGKGSNGHGTWGVATGSSGIGAYGYGPYNIGVYGRGGTGSGDYGGYFWGNTGVFGASVFSSSRGMFGYATGSAGEGIRGATTGNGGDGVTATASSTYGYGVDAIATGYYGFGGRFQSSRYPAIWANGASGYYDAYFPDAIYAGSYWTSGTGVMGIIALNDGSEALEPGGLVAFSGMTAAAEGSSEPMMAVQKVNDANSGAIIGVVQATYVQEGPVEMQPPVTAVEDNPLAVVLEVSQKEDIPPEVGGTEAEQLPPPLPEEAIEVAPEIAEVVPELAAPSAPQVENLMDAEMGHFVEGAAEPGQYVAIVIQGIARVKVDASAAPVRAGDMLVASPAGYAIAASQQREASQPREGSVKPGEEGGVPAKGLPLSQSPTIGRALESLETGTGAIYVFVSVR